MFYSNKSRLQTRTDFAVLRVRELFQFSLQPPQSFAKATDGRPFLLSVDFFVCKNKRSRRRSVRRMPSIALATESFSIPSFCFFCRVLSQTVDEPKNWSFLYFEEKQTFLIFSSAMLHYRLEEYQHYDSC